MGMPSVAISFTEVATSFVKRGEKGIIAMILKDTVPSVNPVVCQSATDVPSTLSEASQTQINLALMGYVNAPKKVVAYVIAKESENYTDALNYFRTIKFDYLVAPSAETDKMTAAIVSYIKEQRTNNKLIKAVLPNTAADCEGIINYTTDAAIENDITYTAEQYCARIAGIIAGTPMSISSTYAPLNELTDCTRLTKDEMDTAEESGKFFIWWDGEKVKTSRAVNSLTTLTDDKSVQFQKIKIVDTMDMISNDIRMTVEDNYLGKYPNTYDNKCLLLSAIGNYFESLVNEKVLSHYTIEIDVDANRNFLKSKGKNVDTMSEDDIKTADTGSFVYMKATIGIVDAIEDIVLPITI